MVMSVKSQKGISLVPSLVYTFEIIRKRESFSIGDTGTENGEHGTEIDRKNETVKRLPPMVTYRLLLMLASNSDLTTIETFFFQLSFKINSLPQVVTNQMLPPVVLA